MGRGSRGKAAGRTPEFPTQVPTRLSGRRGCWSRQGQQHARAVSGAPSWRQAESGRVLPAQRTRVSFVGTVLEWVLPLTLGGPTVSRAQRHKLVPGPQSTGLIPCGQAIERPVLSSVAMPSPLSPVSSTCSLIPASACSFHACWNEHAFPAPGLPSALEQRSQGDKSSGQNLRGNRAGGEVSPKLGKP